MKKSVEINARDRQMLELLSAGASSKLMAKKMGYREGTMRVYLHDLYRKIGVPNKTNAVIWYFDRAKASQAALDAPAKAAAAPVAEESFGDFALRANLHAALGAMNMFLGPYGRIWEVTRRLKGTSSADGQAGRRALTRNLWEALMCGDFAHAKALHDHGTLESLSRETPSDTFLAVVLLLLGGYSRAAEQASAPFLRKRQGAVGISESERTLVTALRDALEGNSDEALTCLYRLATARSSASALPQVATAAMFHVYRARKDVDRARATANALCAIAEDTRQQLQAMGERPLYRQSSIPRPPEASARSVATYVKRISGARSKVEA
jgi:DNA-binding CsgD family transcriptional regulator